MSNVPPLKMDAGGDPAEFTSGDTVAVANGGTGLSSLITDTQFLFSTGSSYTGIYIVPIGTLNQQITLSATNKYKLYNNDPATVAFCGAV